MKKDKKKDKKMNDPSRDKKMKNDDPWSDHPETQFGPIYLFFRNHKPRPTLRT